VLRWFIFVFLQEWLRISRVELDRNPPLCRELRDFLVKVSSCGAPYQQWCAELRQEFPALVSLQRCLLQVSSSRWRDNILGLAISFVMSVCPSARKDQLGSQCKGFYKILYLGISRKPFEKIQVSSKYDKDRKYSTWISIYIQGDSGGICTTLWYDSMSDSKQKSSYEHGSDFERLLSYDHLKLGIEGNDYWQWTEENNKPA